MRGFNLGKAQPHLPPQLTTRRCKLRLLRPDEADKMVAYYVENRRHLEPWEPVRASQFYTHNWWQQRLQQCWSEFEAGTSVCLAILSHDQRRVIGTCNFSQICRGVFQACYMGYSLDKRAEGQGLMVEAVTAALDHMFYHQGLHRVMANYMPSNLRSAALLERLGFEREGYARNYLQINGRWEDHVLTALLKEDFLADR